MQTSQICQPGSGNILVIIRRLLNAVSSETIEPYKGLQNEFKIKTNKLSMVGII
jgi:hypothetical protein